MKTRKSSIITVAALFCWAFAAAGQLPEPAADSLPAQAIEQAAIRKPDAMAQNLAGTKEHTDPTTAADSLTAQAIEQVAIRKLDAMAQDLADTKEHTDPKLTTDSWKTIAGLSLIIAAVGLLVSLLNYDEQRRTQRNTSRLSLEEQRGILIDLIRHLYRNLVVTRTIETKMRALDFRAYPSEEHLVKMQIPLERIKLDSFLNTKFAVLSNLHFLFRNYNEEVMIIKDHFKDPTLYREVKERDIETLTFKCGFLASKIYQLLVDISDKKQEKDADIIKRHFTTVVDILIEIAHNENVDKNAGNAIAPEIEKAITPYMNENDWFMKIFDNEERKKAFWEGLNLDIRIECGNKQKAEEMERPGFIYQYTTDKIYMIRFDNIEKPADGKNETATKRPDRRKNK